MSDPRAIGPLPGLSVLVDAAYRAGRASTGLLPATAAFARFGSELAHLRRIAHPTAAMTFSPAWSRAVPSPPGYAQRFLILHEQGELRAALCLRERTLLGVPTGIFHGSDAKGESLVLCKPGEEAKWLAEGIQLLFTGLRGTALLINRPADSRLYEPETFRPVLEQARLQQRSHTTPFRWRTEIRPQLDQTLAPFGHRTRRNLRHALRRVGKNGWQFLPDLTAGQIAEATSFLATHSTHPYAASAITARLDLERSQENSFSMGLRSSEGEWLSLLSGVRRSGGTTDVFWQSNVARGHESVAMAMRALLMEHEGQQGSSVLRWIGGTSPFMEHCCLPDPGSQTLITRPGVRLALLQRAFETRMISDVNPMQKLLRLKPSEA